MGKTIFEMKHVTKRFSGVVALRDVSFSVNESEIHAICGENGAGKSTLMKVLSGTYNNKEYEGEIWMNGKKQEFVSVADAKECGIEMVYQELNMLLDASVAENVFVGNLPGRGFINWKKLYADTQEILDEIGMDFSPKSRIRTLNSGQMQMLSIMRALVRNPKIIVLDEPTTALSNKEVDILFKFLEKLRANGVSCLFITHKLEEIFRICDRITVMRDGYVISTDEVKNYTNDLLVEQMIGRKIENMYPAARGHGEETVLRVEELSVPNPTNIRRNLIEKISFELKKGEILGIGGLVGAGRSEILGVLFGQITENAQKQIYIEGKAVQITCPRDAIRKGFGFITEERKISGFVGTFSVLHNLSLVALKRLPYKHLFLNHKTEKKEAGSVFERLRIKAPSMETPIINLSGGNQQKVVLGKWLMKGPRILLMDEPTKGVDVGSKAEIYNIMRELTGKGISIIMVSSDMPELVSMSDRCIVISGGRITGEFMGNDITQDNIMRAAIAAV